MKSLPTIVLIIVALCLIVAAYKFGEVREKSKQHPEPEVIGGIPVPGMPPMKISTGYRDYQIDICTDSIAIYDGQRLVSKYATDWKTDKFDSIILKDNE